MNSTAKSTLKNRLTLGLAVAALALTLPAAPVAQAQTPSHSFRIAVTITNITYDQIISPPVVLTHRAGFSLFELGQPASEALRYLAEDGMTGPFTDLLAGESMVYDFGVAEGGIMPGSSMTVELDAGYYYNRVSLAGMLVSTNDAFVALDGQYYQAFGWGSNLRSFDAAAYDAGTEVNTESCEHIPGPPCGNPGMRMPTGAEGFVTVHRGIHGIADLDASDKDWNNPVAVITIERVN